MLTPVITGFSPTGATISNSTFPLITLSGSNLFGKTQVYLNGKPTEIKSSTNSQVVFVPTVKETGKIKVVTSINTATTTSDFVFFK